MIPCVFLPFLDEIQIETLRIIPYSCEIDVRTSPPFGPHKKLLNSNLVSKLVSTAAEWIVLLFDTPYYTELPPYSKKRRLKLGHMSYLPVGAPLFSYIQYIWELKNMLI